MLIKKVVSLLPNSWKRSIAHLINQYKFRKSISEFSQLEDPFTVSDELLKKLIVGWSNQGYSGQITYLKTCLQFAKTSNGSFLECGSGLSTLLLGIALKKSSVNYIAFENNDFWFNKMKEVLLKFQLKNVKLYHTPLIQKEGYDWYDYANVPLPETFSLIICDGPPGQTKGGRLGLVPEMKSKLLPGTVILLDDTVREEERSVIEKWKSYKKFTVAFNNLQDQHAILTIEV